jgi:hypothetical protein
MIVYATIKKIFDVIVRLLTRFHILGLRNYLPAYECMIGMDIRRVQDRQLLPCPQSHKPSHSWVTDTRDLAAGPTLHDRQLAGCARQRSRSVSGSGGFLPSICTPSPPAGRAPPPTCLPAPPVAVDDDPPSVSALQNPTTP